MCTYIDTKYCTSRYRGGSSDAPLDPWPSLVVELSLLPAVCHVPTCHALRFTLYALLRVDSVASRLQIISLYKRAYSAVVLLFMYFFYSL